MTLYLSKLSSKNLTPPLYQTLTPNTQLQPSRSNLGKDNTRQPTTSFSERLRNETHPKPNALTAAESFPARDAIRVFCPLLHLISMAKFPKKTAHWPVCGTVVQCGASGGGRWGNEASGADAWMRARERLGRNEALPYALAMCNKG